MGSSPVAVTAIFFSSYSFLLSLLHSIFSPFCSFLVFLLVLFLFLPSLFIHLFSDAPCCFLFKSSYPLFALPITLLFLLLPLVLFLFNLSSFCYSSSSESSIYTFFLSLKLQWQIWDISQGVRSQGVSFTRKNLAWYVEYSSSYDIYFVKGGRIPLFEFELYWWEVSSNNYFW